MNHPLLTRRAALQTGAVGGVLAAYPVLAQDAATPRGIEEMSLGDADAPVTVIEYASLTCPHCARFHSDVFGRIKTNYIEPGKVRFVYRDVYFDRAGLWGAMVARCGGQERFFGIVDRLLSRQAEWSRLTDPSETIAALFAIGRQAGMTDEEMNACVQDQQWAEALVADYQANMEADQVRGTPTFFINGQMENNMSYRDFAAKLDEELGS